jgi:hypothetical protein
MKRGGAGTVLLVIFFLLIIVVLLFPNQVEQFLSQFNISLGNGTVNLGQVFQQFINGVQGILNIGNSYQNYSTVVIDLPIFNAEDTFNIGVSSESTFVGPIYSFNGKNLLLSPVIVPTNNNINVNENGNNINFQFSLEYSGGCNNTINSIYIQDPELYMGIYSFNPNEVSSYYNYFGNSNFITYDEINQLYNAITNKPGQSYLIIIQGNQYGLSCEPIGVVQLNPTATVSCSINLNQLESDPQIQSIMNEINSAGNSSLWFGVVKIKVSYNCQ